MDYGALATFAFRIIFPKTKLWFGLSGGIRYAYIDWNALDPKHPNDFELSNQVGSKVVPDADFGMYYYGRKFFIGISSKHLIQSQMLVSDVSHDNKDYCYTKLTRHFFGMAGWAFPLNPENT